MSDFKYIQDYYKVPAEIGRRVEYTGNKEPKQGVIVGLSNQYIKIHFDGTKKPIGVFHPTWEMRYLEMGKVPKMTRSQKRYQRYLDIRDIFDSFKDFLGYDMDCATARRLGFSSVEDYYRGVKLYAT